MENYLLGYDFAVSQKATQAVMFYRALGSWMLTMKIHCFYAAEVIFLILNLIGFLSLGVFQFIVSNYCLLALSKNFLLFIYYIDPCISTKDSFILTSG